MARAIVTVAAVVAAVVPLLAWAAPKAAAPAADLKTFEQKISYVIGREIGQGFREAPAQIDLDVFMRGLKDALNARPSPLTAEDEQKARETFTAKMRDEQSKRQALAADKNQKEEEAFLAKNKTQKGVQTTASGLQYQVLREGSGAAIKSSDRVKVHYRGTLIDGTEFDSSYSRNQPAVFDVGGVIPGWTEGLQLMKFGGSYRLWVPSKLAYGVRGAGRQIGPNAMLIFDVEPLEIAN